MQIDVTRDAFPLAQVFRISRGTRTEAKVLTVRIAKDGVTGWGECVPYARYDETLDSVEAQIAGLPAAFDRTALQNLLPAGAARNAVDCALWDLEAKASGKRVWELAGLAPPHPEITAYTLSLDEPDAMRASAAKHAHRPLLKIKLGTPDDMPRLEAVRAARRNQASSLTRMRAGTPRFTLTLLRISAALVWRWLNNRCLPATIPLWTGSRVQCRSALMKAAMIVTIWTGCRGAMTWSISSWTRPAG